MQAEPRDTGSTSARLPRSVVWLLPVTAVMAVLAISMITSRHNRVLLLGGKTYHILVAATDEERHRGLGGRDSLASNEGMLFVFDKPAVQCFWMKDMHFSLDIIWLDAQKKVVHIENNISPDTFPKSYCPKEPTQYVLELRAGEVNRSGIHLGKTLNISSLD